MKKKSIGMVISELVGEKNLSIAQLAERVGKTRQAVYGDLKRTSMKTDMIEEYAAALQVDKKVIYDRMQGVESVNNDSPAVNEYLIEHLTKLEEQFNRLITQLEVKDQQIQSKDRQIEKLIDQLGKPEPDNDQPNVRPLYQAPLALKEA